MLKQRPTAVISNHSRRFAWLLLAETELALERYWRAHQKYPQNLRELVPQFLAKPPLSLVDQEPLRYTPGENGGYELEVPTSARVPYSPKVIVPPAAQPRGRA